MHEDLFAQVTAIVHRHVLVTLHTMTGELIDRLDQVPAAEDPHHPADIDLGGPAPPKPAIAATVKASTVERRERAARAQQRQANGAAMPEDLSAAKPAIAEPAKVDDAWPGLRDGLRLEITRRQLSRGRLAGELEVSKASVTAWLSPGSPKPSDANIAKIERWLTTSAETGPAKVDAAWSALRARFHAEIRKRKLTRGAVAGELGVALSSVCSWLAPNCAAPSAANIAAVERWIARKPTTEPPLGADEWPPLREQLRAIIHDRGMTHMQVGRAIGVEPPTVSGWLSPSHLRRSPGPQAMLRLSAWLAEGAIVDPHADAPPFVLSLEERNRLAADLSLGDVHELRHRFGATRELLEQAAAGEHLNGEIIARLRSTLANGAAAG